MRPDSGTAGGPDPREAAALLLDKIRQGDDYAGGKKRRFGRSASLTKVATLVLSAASTVILGLQDLNAWADLALACVALVTLLGAVEPFFNWRSRSVLMEEAQYRFRRLADDLEYLLATTAAGELTFDRLGEVHVRYQAIWDDLSRGWLEQRRVPAPSTAP
ncbi:SLATT domain-containing protein [Streptomyces sp. NRRL S-87]|uniref:SLATT domain-containing protein n=1 Tax=Streptomyces sp. NRRL S-87 TaxID=1463920 RepID=UPI00068D669E|nr:SLATT domain-containing protein [Streptomyces sp. NRRL S-87]